MQRIDEVNKNKCYGCTACLAVCPVHAINMVADEHGFAYPTIDENKCIHCNLCAKVCISERHLYNQNYIAVYGVKHKDDTVRLNSTSGGAFTAFSDIILAEGGVVYGVAYDDKIVARFIRADSSVARNRCRGSKYVQADVGEIFLLVKQDLDEGRKVLFTGTPCQVAGLQAFLRKKYANLFTMDIVCHGTVSPMIFADHIKLLEKIKGKKIIEYKNRSKVDGWGVHTEKVMYSDVTSDHISIISQSYKMLFYTHLAFRPSCYGCDFCNLQRVGDLTVCDMWGIEGCAPDFKDKKGVSLVLVNSDKGRELFAKADMLERIIPQTDSWIQPNMQHPSLKNAKSEEFWEYYLEKGYRSAIGKYCGCNWLGSLKRMIKKGLKVVHLENSVVNMVRAVRHYE